MTSILLFEVKITMGGVIDPSIPRLLYIENPASKY